MPLVKSNLQLKARRGKTPASFAFSPVKLKDPTLHIVNTIASDFELPLETLLLSEFPSYNFQDLLQQSENIENKIGSLKNELYKFQQLLETTKQTGLPAAP